MTILEMMQAVRAEFPEAWTHEDRGRYLNKVAWIMKIEGIAPMGLLRKPAGNNCPSPAGTLCSCDYIVDFNTMFGYDVLINEQTPTWPGFEQPSDNFSATPERWLAPVDPGTPTPVPEPEPGPTPTPDPPIAELAARVAELEHRADSIVAFGAEIINQIGIINRQLADLTGVVNKPLRAVGATNRVWGHSHWIDIGVRKEE